MKKHVRQAILGIKWLDSYEMLGIDISLTKKRSTFYLCGTKSLCKKRLQWILRAI